jgi:hypothetical protein
LIYRRALTDWFTGRISTPAIGLPTSPDATAINSNININQIILLSSYFSDVISWYEKYRNFSIFFFSFNKLSRGFYLFISFLTQANWISLNMQSVIYNLHSTVCPIHCYDSWLRHFYSRFYSWDNSNVKGLFTTF